MTWKTLQGEHRVEPHATSRGELDELRAVVQRNLKDASLKGLSHDNRFAIAYQAALLAAKMAIACAGYRVKGQGAHQTTFQALRLVLGSQIGRTADYLDRCRRKRNQLEYDAAEVVAAADAEQLIKEAKILWREVEAWISAHHPEFASHA